MKVLRSVPLMVFLVWTASAPALAAPFQATTPQATPTPTPKPDPKADPKADQKPEQSGYKETVVVSASKTEEKIVNAPATMSVISSKTLESSPATNYADILRTVPGVNASQISARDINVTSRAASSSLATSQLAILDGRTLYQDFFGFTMWDFMPVNVDEIKQIEVIRGPASAVWGANALNGVVNVITKTPRENPGTTAILGFGGFPGSVTGHDADAGSLFYINASESHVVNDQWAFRIAGGGYSSDALPRPVGTIPGSATGQQYPPFANEGTTQPKFDARFDFDSASKSYSMSFSGGAAATSGIMHSGIGPFSVDNGSTMSYGKWNYNRGAMHFQAFGNFLNGDASNLLTIGPDGQPILFSFRTKTIDLEYGDTRALNAHHVVTYGANLRLNRFKLTIAPGEDHRTEGGGYIQDEIFLNDNFRFVVGARADKFTSIGSTVFSPRVAFLWQPNKDNTMRISYNRAFRAPSMINNNLDVTIATQLPLSVLSPAFGNAIFLVPTFATGNPDLTQEHVDAVEVSYTGVINERTVVSLAVYYNTLNEEILFTETAEWPLLTPPPGWPAAAGILGWAAVQSQAHFPQSFTYLNLGREKNRGLELGIDSSLDKGVSVYMNYSYQAEPLVNFDLSETNVPSRHRFNWGVSFNDPRWLASASLSSASEAFYQDVLDERFHGTTKPYWMVNASLGRRFGGGRYTAMFKATNLFNQEIQQHIFGDVIRRQLIGELRVRLAR